MNRRRTIRWSALAAAASLALAPGVLAQSTASAITPAEAQEGARYHPQFLQEFGGAMSGPQAAYVTQVGRNIAVQSGLANSQSAFTVTLLNSSLDNAFAIPGGYVYVTRQLVSLMNNEAELAGVLGHEVGHVAARHSARRQQAAQRNSILGAIGAVLSGVILGNSQLGQLGQQLASAVPQLATLRYSRAQEVEADNLGVRYLRAAGYDPRAMASVLQSLAAQNALDGQLQGRSTAVPEWASTHPDPASRVRGAQQQAGTAATGLTNRDTFLTRIDGLVYGDDPAQGVIEGNAFIHPEMRLTFAVPDGFYMINGSQAVSITGQSGQAQFTTQAYSGDLDRYVRQALQAVGGQQAQLTPQTVQRTTVNGLPAAYAVVRTNSGQSQVDVVVYAYEFARNQAYHFAAIVPAGRGGVFNPMFGSVRRISTAEAAQVVPRVLDVVTAARGDTVQSLAGRMAYGSAQVERFRVLNGLASGAQVVPGQRYKVVVRGR
ncbi:MAG: peptidase M48 Ste24p [Sphingomonadales bacterium 12-68-11]|nr:MAG: peptidase M48 Ste24p [Sphingomonadales bacterium 12-68-11]OYX16776.1 MAG: peptidase M48 Ste24p [Sphingomonadales bacterium 32-67-7]